jgi:hypothetical protein
MEDRVVPSLQLCYSVDFILGVRYHFGKEKGICRVWEF